jgi:hypothetical protein
MAAAFMADPHRTIPGGNMASFGFKRKVWPMLMADLSADVAGDALLLPPVFVWHPGCRKGGG